MKKINLLFVSTLISCFTLFANVELNGIHYELNSENNTATVVGNKVEGINYPNLTEVVIPATITSEEVTYRVTAIGDMAFSDCSTLTSVELPNTLDSIGFSAFYNATSLVNVNIPSSVIKIGWQAFGSCKSLLSINVPDGVTSISDMTFSGCSSLTTVELGSGIQSIAMMGFANAKAITEFTCHAAVPPTVGMMAFASAIYQSATLYVPESSIDAYKEASEWKKFSVIKAIGDTTSTIVPTIVTVEIDGIFYTLDSEKNTAAVAKDTINDYQSIINLVIPETVTYNNVNYTVNTIKDGAFIGCPNLTTIELPKTLETIGMAAFLNSPEIKKVTCHAVVPPTFTMPFIDAFLDEVCSVATLIVPAGSEEAYKNATFWKDFAVITTQTDPTTAVNNQNEEIVLIYSNNNTIYFNNLTTTYQIFNVSGKLIYEGTETSLTLPNGTYVVRINNQITKVVL